MRAFLNGNGELVEESGKVRVDWVGHQGNDELQLGSFLRQILLRFFSRGITGFIALLGSNQLLDLKEFFKLRFQAAAS